MISFLDFEKPIAELEARIHDLRQLAGEQQGGANIEEEVAKLQSKADQLLRDTYSQLTPWQKVQVARHPNRPQFQDYVTGLIDSFTPLAGDRAYADDKAITGGIGRFRGRSVMVIGHEKGSDTQSRLRHNFGMARPEGYRKAARLMRLADRFGLPVITLVDTQGAYPGVGAEERGQAEAIAHNIMDMSLLRVPIVCVVIGEGGSGGALGVGIGDRLLMQENAYYSVISPEGCASILWRDAKFAPQAAEALRLTAKDLTALGIVDEMVVEPLGGAHRDPQAATQTLGETLERHLVELEALDLDELLQKRFEKYRSIGVFEEASS